MKNWPGNCWTRSMLFNIETMQIRIAFIYLLLFATVTGKAQYTQEKLIAFKITDYMKPLSDSVTVVQVLMPASFPVAIPEKQLGVLYHCYKTGVPMDTAMIGWGRCNLIKGDYYYFGVHLQKKQQPAEGDIIYLMLKIPFVYDGHLLKVMNHAIVFTSVYGEPFMKPEAVFTNARPDEESILDSMVKDIRFTGSAMQQQIPEQNQPIAKGMYKGKKLFEAMESVQRSDLEAFLKYLVARPKNYAGNKWKISEVFATWMSEGAPTVISD